LNANDQEMLKTASKQIQGEHVRVLKIGEFSFSEKTQKRECLANWNYCEI
jgi:hypothetical protein